MMVSADAKYPKRVYLRADQEFTDKVERIRGTHALKSSSSAIRYAVDYTAACDLENEMREKHEDSPESGVQKRKNENDPENYSSADSKDAETVRRVSVEIETLAQDGRERGYLSEDQVKILLAYHRELSRSVRKLAGLDG